MFKNSLKPGIGVKPSIAPFAAQQAAVVDSVKKKIKTFDDDPSKVQKTFKSSKKKANKEHIGEKTMLTMRLDKSVYAELVKISSEITLEEEKVVSVQSIISRFISDGIKRHKRSAA